MRRVGETHYEILGVARGATAEEVRRAYLLQARLHHPDRHRAGGERAAEEAERRMRLVNEAWSVLGDVQRRRRYDMELALGASGAAPGSGSGPSSRITRPDTTFRPYRPDTPEDPDEDDAWRYEPDHGDPDSVPPKLLLAAPPALLALGLVLLVISVPLGGRVLVAVGFVCLLGAALLFVGAPVVALFRSRATEERARRRRR